MHAIVVVVARERFSDFPSIDRPPLTFILKRISKRTSIARRTNDSTSGELAANSEATVI